LFEYCKSLPQNMIDLIKAANARHIPKKGSRFRLPFFKTYAYLSGLSIYGWNTPHIQGPGFGKQDVLILNTADKQISKKQRPNEQNI
jgi:hypothetical protein